MCDYTYRNGERCRLKPLEGSKYCPLHVPFEEGERLLGRERLAQIKEETFKRRLQAGQTYFEGVYLYTVRIEEFKAKKPLVFRDSQIGTLFLHSLDVQGITLYNCRIERVIIVGGRMETLFMRDSEVFGLNVIGLEFHNSIVVSNSTVRYVMMNSLRFVRQREGEETNYERNDILGRIELSDLRNVRKIAFNSSYPLVQKLLEEYGVEEKEVRRKFINVSQLLIRNVEFDWAPRFRRGVRIRVLGFRGNLIMEGTRVPGHVEIAYSRLRSPEFVHVNVLSNLVMRKTHLQTDRMWNMTVLPNLPVELSVEGFVIIEDCSFSSPYAEEVFYRLARTSWERSGDFERADNYYYLEMVARRKIRRTARVRGFKKLFINVEIGFEWLFADLTCKYGTDWKRPIVIWLFTVNVLFPLLFSATHSIVGVSSPGGILDYEYFSIVTATTLGYGDYHPVGVGRAIASLEALFGMFMWAVFLTVFARKYMR